MNQQETAKLTALLIATSAYYSHTIPDAVLSLYVEDLVDLDFTAVCQAIGQMRRDPKQSKMPLPAQVRNMILPADTSESDARAAASRIVEAVARFGWPNHMRAKEFLSGLSWGIVESQGGWPTICSMLNQDNLVSLQAQWRELAKSMMIRAKAGTLNSAIPMPVNAVTKFPPVLQIESEGPTSA